MKSLSQYLKVRAMRLGLMAAFVVTFMGLPALGHTLNIDAFKKLDAFNLGDNLLAWCDNMGMCYPDGPSTPPPTDTGSSTYVPPPTTTSGSTSTAPATTTGSTSTTGTTGYPTVTTGTSTTTSTSTYTYVDPATGQTTTGSAPTYFVDPSSISGSTTVDWSTYDPNTSTTWQSWSEDDWQAVDVSQMSFDETFFTNAGGETYEVIEWTDMNWSNVSTDAYEIIEWNQVDGQVFEGEEFWSSFDAAAAGTEFWGTFSEDPTLWGNVDTNVWAAEEWISFAENGDTSSVEGQWDINAWNNYYTVGLEGMVDYSQMSEDEMSRYYTATSGVADMYQTWSVPAWNGTMFGDEYWSEWSSVDGGSYWSDYDYNTDAGYYMGEGGDYFYPTEYGFLKDEMGSFYDMSGKMYEQEEGSKYGMWEDFFEDEDGGSYFAHGGTMYPWNSEEGGFEHEIGDIEIISDYWWTGDFDWDSEYGSWEDWSWDESEYDWSNWEEYDESWLQPLPPVEFNAQIGTLENDLEGVDPERDWTYLQKQSDDMVDQLLTTVEVREEEVARYEAAGEEAAPLEGAVETLNEVVKVTQEVLAEMDVLEALETEDLMQIEAAVLALDENSTVAEMQAIETDVQKLEIYEVMRAMMDSQSEHIAVLGEMSETVEEMGVVEQHYADGEIPSDVESVVDSLNMGMEDLVAYRDTMTADYDDMKVLAEEVRLSTDPAFVEEGLAELWTMAEEMEGTEKEMIALSETLKGEGYIEEMGEFIEDVHMLAQAEEMAVQVGTMNEEIGAAKEVIDVLSTIQIEDSAVERAVIELSKLADQGLDVLGQMEEFLDSDATVEHPEVIADLWKVMDGLGYSAEENMATVIEWVAQDPEALADLPAEDQESVLAMVENFGNYHAQEIDYSLILPNFELEESKEWEESTLWENQNEFDGAIVEFANTFTNIVYDDDIALDTLIAEIGPEQIATITREIPETVMVDLVAEITDLEDSEGVDTLTFALANANVVGTEIMEATLEVYEVLDGINMDEAQNELLHQNPDLQPQLKEMEGLLEQIKETLVSKGNAEVLVKVCKEARLLLEVGGTEEEFDAVNVELEEVLEENHDALVREEEILFEDVSADEWYYNDVINARQDGIVSGMKDESGELTGDFNPGASITNGEALKMVLEAAGEGTASGTPSNEEAQGHWSAPYFKQGEDLGLSDLANMDPNATCDRGQVAVWISEAFELGGEDMEYLEGTFPDVDGGSDSGHYQAVYKFEIFTGDSKTGELRPNDEINRAEVSKVVNTATETAGSMNEIEHDLEAVQADLEEIEVLGSENNMMEDVTLEREETISLLNLLKNFFSSIFSF